MSNKQIPAEVRDGLKRISAGELSYRLPRDATQEGPDSSATIFNAFADELEQRLEKSQRNEARLEAAIESVSKALIAVAAGDLEVHIERDMQGDSLDVLSFLVNSTIDELRLVLEDNRSKSEEIRIELENAVQARTQELSHALSDLKKAQREAEIGREAAEAANRAKSAFLANMSHELRSPLNAILGFTQILARRPDVPAEHRKSLAIVERSGEHLLALINQVLDLSKIESGRMAINSAPLDLRALMHDVEDMFRVQAEEQGLQLTLGMTGDIPQFIQSDEIKLRQILINLLNNAVKFTDRGGVSVHVNGRRLDKTTVGLHFEVEDTGAGIAEEQLESVFESFSQVGAGQLQQEGSGLGLTICKRFVEILGGTIEVSSEVGKGTIFAFDVNCEIESAASYRAGRRRQEDVAKWRQAIALAPDQPRYRVLLVDDNPDNVAVLFSLLTPFGFELQRAANGREAVEIWQSWNPDLVFMDLRMPVMDGYEATRRIKAGVGGPGGGKRPVVIAVSASSFDANRTDALAAGCDDHIGKPFRDSEILAALHEHLGARFLFEGPRVAKSQPSSLGTGDETERCAISEEALKKLEDAIEMGDIVLIESAIGEVAAQDAVLAERLRTMADDFKHEDMLDCIRSYWTATSREP